MNVLDNSELLRSHGLIKVAGNTARHIPPGVTGGAFLGFTLLGWETSHCKHCHKVVLPGLEPHQLLAAMEAEDPEVMEILGQRLICIAAGHNLHEPPYVPKQSLIGVGEIGANHWGSGTTVGHSPGRGAGFRSSR